MPGECDPHPAITAAPASAASAVVREPGVPAIVIAHLALPWPAPLASCRFGSPYSCGNLKSS